MKFGKLNRILDLYGKIDSFFKQVGITKKEIIALTSNVCNINYY